MSEPSSHAMITIGWGDGKATAASCVIWETVAMAMRGLVLPRVDDGGFIGVDVVGTGTIERRRKAPSPKSRRREDLVRRRHLLWFAMNSGRGFGVRFGVREIASLFGYTPGVVCRGIKAGRRLATEVVRDGE